MKTLTLLSTTAAVALMTGSLALAQTKPQTQPPSRPATPATPATPADPVAPPSADVPPTPAVPSATPATPATPAAPATPAVVAKGDIVETLRASGQFTTLTKALDATNLTNVLKTNQNLTLFAPTDAAFAAMPAGELDRLMKNPAELQKLLTGHLINANVDSTKIKGAKGPVNSVAGPAILLDGSGDSIMAGNATVVQPDIKATNGTIHVVDKVIRTAGTPAAFNMTTDVGEGRAIRASWQQPTPDPAPPATTAPAEQQTNPSDEAPAEQVEPTAPTMPSSGATAVTPTTDPAAQVAAATAQPTVITNGPVLDTAENRAKYPPQSRAGKRTAARGNR
ncbi:MAG TPA: fasciclin domain-containing protein [Caulobacter sp.]|nr:fasciclin domain-containing protein [Caulobacter sp.]